MRVISNRSTGTLGQTIARDFVKSGARVTLLEGPVEKRLESKAVKVLKFRFFDEFAPLIKKELKKKYDICIHAAAVSDYRVRNVSRTKLSSHLRRVKLALVPTEKIVHSIKELAPKTFLVAFKLESTMTKTAAKQKTEALFRDGKCDLVVANSTEGPRYCGYIVDKNKKILTHQRSRREISKALVNLVKDRL
jgi:phosphopantothenoylcysteine decarboxylase/phosphopantothenate--cysteine ligase